MGGERCVGARVQSKSGIGGGLTERRRFEGSENEPHAGGKFQAEVKGKAPEVGVCLPSVLGTARGQCGCC